MSLSERYRTALSPRRFLKSLGHAFAGVSGLFASEANALIHLLFVAAVPVAAFLLNVSATEWCLLILCIGLVLAAEALNTAIERLSDRISQEYSPLIKDAKDLAAGAVLILSCTAAAVGLIIFIPAVCRLL